MYMYAYTHIVRAHLSFLLLYHYKWHLCICFPFLNCIFFLSPTPSPNRDLKPENLVFCQTASNNVCIKLTDFGLSRTFMPGEMIESSCGSLEYSAPEILLGDFYDPPKVGTYQKLFHLEFKFFCCVCVSIYVF